jgi:hypothetical protein
MKTTGQIQKRLFCDPNKKPPPANASDLELSFCGSLRSKRDYSQQLLSHEVLEILPAVLRTGIGWRFP